MTAGLEADDKDNFISKGCSLHIRQYLQNKV